VVRHLVAYFGNEPENLACALFPARPALQAQGDRAAQSAPDGFGLGFVQGGDVLLQKRPRAETSEVDLYGLVKETRADALVGRIGLGHDGNTAAEDADPFRFRSWLFASLGDLDEPAFDAVRDRILESTPAFLRRNIRGKSPSEHIFHLFLAFLHDAGILDQPTPAPTAVHAALRNSLAFVDRLLVGEGAAALRIAICATNGRCFVATGCDYPIRYLHIEGIADCPVCLERTDTNQNRRRVQHDALRALIVEANRDVAVRSGWREVPNRSALIAGPDRVPHISSL
jgi:predicted glutamine amidotransferase